MSNAERRGRGEEEDASSPDGLKKFGYVHASG